MRSRRIGYAIVILVLLSVQAFADVMNKPAKFRTSFEEMTLPANEKMGIQGFTLLYGVNDYLSLGPALYGALTGQRGGFITLGLAADVSADISETLAWNAGVFVGGGGGRGGYTIQGGGLQVRSHLGLDVNLDHWGNLSGGMSYEDFPNGSIHSFQPYMAYTYDFNVLVSTDWKNDVVAEHHDALLTPDSSLSEFSVVYRKYLVPKGVLNDTLKPQFPSLSVMGVEWRRYVSEHVYVKGETEGAMAGKSTGYMQILAGGGYAVNITNSTKITGSASLGVAGGGKVSTAGGFLVDASLSLQQNITDALFVELGGGYVVAPEGDFKAVSLNAYVGYQYDMPDIGNTSIADISLADFEQHHLRLRYVHQTYIQNAPKWRNHHADLSVRLLGLQNDYFLSDNVYLSGQGIAAYDGQAGNYMIGLVGVGVHYPWGTTPVFTDLEFLVGAAGGGGLDVAGGLVLQSNFDLGYQLSESNRVAVSYGEIKATGGNFKAHVVGAAISCDFSLFAR